MRYVLPLSSRDALVEYTEFTRKVIADHEYDAALRHYTRDVLRLGAFTVTASEQGVIPMTDARLTTRIGRRVLRIGAAEPPRSTERTRAERGVQGTRSSPRMPLRPRDGINYRSGL